MSGALPRVHLVTPAVVERTVVRYGVAGILAERGDRVLGSGSIAIRYTVAVALSR